MERFKERETRTKANSEKGKIKLIYYFGYLKHSLFHPHLYACEILHSQFYETEGIYIILLLILLVCCLL